MRTSWGLEKCRSWFRRPREDIGVYISNVSPGKPVFLGLYFACYMMEERQKARKIFIARKGCGAVDQVMRDFFQPRTQIRVYPWAQGNAAIH